MSIDSRPEGRLASLDAYRGFIMLLMASAGFGIPAVAKNLPDSFWPRVAPWFEHVPWSGGVLWDMIQPAFMFMVGVAAAYSTAKRLQRGDPFGAVLRHAALRAVVLVLLAVLLASNSPREKQTVWLFTNVLGQIGLGYFFLAILAHADRTAQFGAVLLILGGSWLAFALWPLHPAPPGADRPWMSDQDLLAGFFAHWNPHTNVAAAFDRSFLNLFPRSTPYVTGSGGYQTLNFVPSLATMLLGLVTGNHLRGSRSPGEKLRDLLLAAAVCLALGFAAGHTVCPIVKRIWTPSWVLWSTGWVLLMLAAFYGVIDVLRLTRWALPLTVVGMNSITIYLGHQLCAGWIRETLARHLGPGFFSGPYQPMLERCGVLLVLWLFCGWLWRQRAFLRI